jgi:hypothetical protein
VPNDDETLAHPEQPRFLLNAWLWAVVLFVFFGAIVAITFGTMQRGSSYEEERAKARAEKLKTAEEEWNKTSSSYGWVDKEKGVARIPIERAMQLELADLQLKKPAPAGPILTPTPAEAPVASTVAPQPANPPNAAPAPSAAAPNSPSVVLPVPPTVAPAQHPPGAPLPVGGKKQPSTSPSPPKR